MISSFTYTIIKIHCLCICYAKILGNSYMYLGSQFVSFLFHSSSNPLGCNLLGPSLNLNLCGFGVYHILICDAINLLKNMISFDSMISSEETCNIIIEEKLNHNCVFLTDFTSDKNKKLIQIMGFPSVLLNAKFIKTTI